MASIGTLAMSEQSKKQNSKKKIIKKKSANL